MGICKIPLKITRKRGELENGNFVDIGWRCMLTEFNGEIYKEHHHVHTKISLHVDREINE